MSDVDVKYVIDHQLEEDLKFRMLVEEYRRKFIAEIREECPDLTPQCWGPQVWARFHALALAVPCPACSSEAQAFLSFFHDYVNKHRGKPLYSPVNYENVKREICHNA